LTILVSAIIGLLIGAVPEMIRILRVLRVLKRNMPARAGIRELVGR
jgi:uncharacterized integral membrane protein